MNLYSTASNFASSQPFSKNSGANFIYFWPCIHFRRENTAGDTPRAMTIQVTFFHPGYFFYENELYLINPRPSFAWDPIIMYSSLYSIQTILQ